MIFPDKPRPPWQYAKPKLRPLLEKSYPAEVKENRAVPKPPGYYRERIEFALIVIGMYFWIQFWIRFV